MSTINRQMRCLAKSRPQSRTRPSFYRGKDTLRPLLLPQQLPLLLMVLLSVALSFSCVSVAGQRAQVFDCLNMSTSNSIPTMIVFEGGSTIIIRNCGGPRPPRAWNLDPLPPSAASSDARSSQTATLPPIPITFLTVAPAAPPLFRIDCSNIYIEVSNSSIQGIDWSLCTTRLANLTVVIRRDSLVYGSLGILSMPRDTNFQQIEDLRVTVTESTLWLLQNSSVTPPRSPSLLYALMSNASAVTRNIVVWIAHEVDIVRNCSGFVTHRQTLVRLGTVLTELRSSTSVLENVAIIVQNHSRIRQEHIFSSGETLSEESTGLFTLFSWGGTSNVSWIVEQHCNLTLIGHGATGNPGIVLNAFWIFVSRLQQMQVRILDSEIRVRSYERPSEMKIGDCVSQGGVLQLRGDTNLVSLVSDVSVEVRRSSLVLITPAGALAFRFEKAMVERLTFFIDGESNATLHMKGRFRTGETRRVAILVQLVFSKDCDVQIGGRSLVPGESVVQSEEKNELFDEFGADSSPLDSNNIPVMQVNLFGDIGATHPNGTEAILRATSFHLLDLDTTENSRVRVLAVDAVAWTGDGQMLSNTDGSSLNAMAVYLINGLGNISVELTNVSWLVHISNTMVTIFDTRLSTHFSSLFTAGYVDNTNITVRFCRFTFEFPLVSLGQQMIACAATVGSVGSNATPPSSGLRMVVHDTTVTYRNPQYCIPCVSAVMGIFSFLTLFQLQGGSNTMNSVRSSVSSEPYFGASQTQISPVMAFTARSLALGNSTIAGNLTVNIIDNIVNEGSYVTLQGIAIPELPNSMLLVHIANTSSHITSKVPLGLLAFPAKYAIAANDFFFGQWIVENSSFSSPNPDYDTFGFRPEFYDPNRVSIEFVTCLLYNGRPMKRLEVGLYVIPYKQTRMLSQCRINETVSPTITLSEELHEQVRVVLHRQTLPKISRSFAIGVLAGAWQGTMSGAVAMQRSNMLLQAALCAGDDALYDVADPASSPTQLGIGAERGRYVRGTVVGNFALWAALTVLVGGVAALLRWRDRDLTWVRCAMALEVPGLLSPFFAALLPPTAAQAAALLSSPADGADVAVGVAGVAVSAALAGALVAVSVMAGPRADARPARRRRGLPDAGESALRRGMHAALRALTVPRWQWFARSRRPDRLLEGPAFVATQGGVFTMMVRRRAWWAGVEVSVSVAASVVSGVVSDNRTVCTAILVVNVAASALLLLGVLYFRPYDTLQDRLFSIVSNAFALVVAVLAVADVDNEALADSLLAQCIFSIVLLVPDILSWLLLPSSILHPNRNTPRLLRKLVLLFGWNDELRQKCYTSLMAVFDPRVRSSTSSSDVSSSSSGEGSFRRNSAGGGRLRVQNEADEALQLQQQRQKEQQQQLEAEKRLQQLRKLIDKIAISQRRKQKKDGVSVERSQGSSSPQDGILHNREELERQKQEFAAFLMSLPSSSCTQADRLVRLERCVEHICVLHSPRRPQVIKQQ